MTTRPAPTPPAPALPPADHPLWDVLARLLASAWARQQAAEAEQQQKAAPGATHPGAA